MPEGARGNTHGHRYVLEIRGPRSDGRTNTWAAHVPTHAKVLTRHTLCRRAQEPAGAGTWRPGVLQPHPTGPTKACEAASPAGLPRLLVRPQTGRRGPCGCLGAARELWTEPARRTARGRHLAPPRNCHLAGGWAGQDADYTPWGWLWPSPQPWRAPAKGPDGTEEMAQASLDP